MCGAHRDVGDMNFNWEFHEGEDMRTPFVVLACSLLCSASAWAQAKPAVKGQEIAQKAKAAKLDRDRTTTAEFKGKKIAFTPADLSHVKQDSDAEAGQVIGVLETEAAGDETGLPPGKYNVFAAKVGDQWRAYAEAGGEIVKEAVNVRMERSKERPTSLKPEFREKGWCYRTYYGGWFSFFNFYFFCW